MRILCIGDIFGKPGRQAVAKQLATIIENKSIDFVIANGENAAGGIGLSFETAKDLLALPIDVITTGNHIWKHKDLIPLLEKAGQILRPYNYPSENPGRGAAVFTSKKGIKIAVVNLLGRIFLEHVLCPFHAMDQVLAELKNETPLIIVDFHAEATSEKRALAWYLDGKVSALFGTHTHVPTADGEVLPGGTGYITDVGMTGPHHSVIGMRKEEVIGKFLTQRPRTYKVADEDVRFSSVIFEIDPDSGRTIRVEQVIEKIDIAKIGAKQ